MSIDRVTVEANGLTFSCLKEGEGSQLILFLHGFPDCAEAMRPLMKEFDSDRFTKVAPSLRGYAPTGIPQSDSYFILDLARDVIELIQAFDRNSAVIVGHDWGAPAGYAAANMNPDMVRGTIGMAVPPLRVYIRNLIDNPEQLYRSSYMLFFQLSWLPEQLLSLNDFQLIEWLYEAWSPDAESASTYLETVKDNFRKPGRLSSALNYYRTIFQGYSENKTKFLDSLALSLKTLEVPGLIFSGEEDGCISPSMFNGVETAFRGFVKSETLSEAGHFMHQERPEKIGKLTKNFIDREL